MEADLDRRSSPEQRRLRTNWLSGLRNSGHQLAIDAALQLRLGPTLQKA
jgi:hypothetical protein